MSGLSLAGFSTGYGRRLVLDGIDLAPVAPGSLVAVLGANGAGKSTLLKALAGLRGAHGRAVLDGADLLALPVGRRARQVGYLPQSIPQASSLIAYEAVLSALRATDPLLPRVEAEGRIEEAFDALEVKPLALSKLGELSGGQRQMIGLAQVIVRRPRLMLLDEPTSALDLRWQLAVLQTVRALAAGQGAVGLVAIHDINLALRFCDRVLVLGGGRVLADGGAEALTPEVLRRAYGIEGRVEACSQGHPLVVADRALPAAMRG